MTPILLTLDLRSDPQADGERHRMTLQEAILLVNQGRSLKHTYHYAPRTCRYCSEEYTPLTGNQVFCTEDCQVKYYNEARQK